MSADRDLERVDRLLRDQARAPAPALHPKVMARIHRRAGRPLPPRGLSLVRAALLAAVLVGLGAGATFLFDEPETPLAPRTVRFVHHAPQASRVILVGDFNGWSPAQGAVMRRADGGRFVTTLELPPGRYAYAFVIDDQRVVRDPAAPLFEDDGFGGRNSVVEL